MAEPIKVGDLVMVVRGHSCVLEHKGGIPFTVTGIKPAIGGGFRCRMCGTRNIASHEYIAAELSFHNHRDCGVPITWLKRIPPLGELDDVKQDEEITA